MKKSIIFFIVSFALAVLNGYFFNYINNAFIHIKNDINLNEFSKVETIIIVIILAPLLETLIFQHIIYLFLKKLKVKNDILCIFIMSLLFSLMHWYNWLYVVMIFFSGLILNNLYVYYYKNNSKYFFILTFLFHSLFNLYGFLFVV